MAELLRIGPFVVRLLTGAAQTDGETGSGLATTGLSTRYELTGPEGLHLTIRDTRWASGERDVVAYERHESPERFDTLVDRLA